MAYNLSSNQQYLLSLVQQNNPEILSKFLNEVTQEEREKSKAAKEDPLGAVQMARVRKGIITGTDEQQALLKYSDDKEAKRQAQAAKHYKDVFDNLEFNPKEITPQQAAEVAMYKAMTKEGNIGGESGKKLKAAVEVDIPVVTSTGGSTTMSSPSKNVRDRVLELDDETLAKKSVNTDYTNPSPSTQSKVALRYQKKAEENALPLEHRPISPFYKTTRSEFSFNLGRDFDASGGANPENMRTLVNVKTNLAGRLHDAERDWRDKISYEEQMKAAEKAGGNPLAMMMATLNAKREAEKKHKVHNYRMSDLDVPPRLQPKEIRYNPRTISTEPEVDTSSETEWFGADLFKALGGTPDMLDDNKQASNLSGKSVNQKISRIA
jgi:hypothetical protein